MEKNIELEKRFGAKLAYVRKARKLSQMKLAEIVNMNFNYIGQIERGEANVTIKTMKVLALYSFPNFFTAGVSRISAYIFLGISKPGL